MDSGKVKFLSATLILMGTVAAAFAGNFAVPAEGPVAFRRDRVPLDTEAMAQLSNQLAILADETDGSTPEVRRGAAQMLALSLGLDPSNKRARAMLGEFETGSHRPVADRDKVKIFRTRIWRDMGWLESSEAGVDGLALADCLKDVLAVSDPKDARSEEWLTHGEQGAWDGWIPELVSYQDRAAVDRGRKPQSAEAPPGDMKPKIRLANASVMVPLWNTKAQSEPPNWVQDLAPLQMTAGASEDGDGSVEPFSIRIGAAAEGGQFDRLQPVLRQNLLKQHGKLPVGCWVVIDSPELEASILSNKRHSISAAAAVLASAAISGRSPDAAIIGTLDASGAFKLPSEFWQQLRSIISGNGSRLILPADAAEVLPSMLALEKPQFFLDHEVLLASDFKQLLDLSAGKQEDALASASAQFQQIREKSQGQPLGQYLANSFIRRRLADLAQAAPYHYSARMLAIQGAGNRPAFVTRDVLVSELQRAIKPMDWLIKHSYEAFTSEETARIGGTFETCRAEVERLSRYSNTTDRVMVDRALEMVNLIRGLDRAAKARPDPLWVGGMGPAQQSALSALRKSHAAVLALLNPAQSGAVPDAGP